MNGLEAVELKSSTIKKENIDFRLDAEYFKKENLYLLKLIEKKGYKKIIDFAIVTDGIHTSIDYSEDSNINLISATSPKENYFDLSRGVFISEISHKANPRTALKINDVIISTVGTIGNCAVVDKTIIPANSDRHVGIIRIKNDFKPRFVSTFLLSKFGRFQTLRESTGNVQLNLFIYKIKNLFIPNLSDAFQLQIEHLVTIALNNIEKSKFYREQAEKHLLNQLGLHNWQPTEANTEVKSFKNSFLQSGRLDAEYYQPKYDDFFSILETTSKKKKWPIVNLGILSEPLKYGSSTPYEYQSLGVPFLRIADLSNYEFDKRKLKYISRKDASTEQESAKVKANDILISRSGTLGLTVPIPKELEGAVYGSYFIRIRPKSNDINTTFISFYMNSLAGQIQVEQVNTGGIQTNLTIPVIETFKIPLPDLETQNNLVQKVTESLMLRKKSEHLLETAKQAVEKAIEKSEEAAMEFIKNNYHD